MRKIVVDLRAKRASLQRDSTVALTVGLGEAFLVGRVLDPGAVERVEVECARALARGQRRHQIAEVGGGEGDLKKGDNFFFSPRLKERKKSLTGRLLLLHLQLSPEDEGHLLRVKDDREGGVEAALEGGIAAGGKEKVSR